MHASSQLASTRFAAIPGPDFARNGWSGFGAALHLKVLTTPEERQVLVPLRKHAPMGVEDDLGAGLMPFESARDDVGVVTAIYRGAKLVGTLRLVPSGLRLTAAERVWTDRSAHRGILGTGNWEVGRLIVAPEERSPELLQQCFCMALQVLMDTREVEHFYAISTPAMARLWRRFGMHATAPLVGASGRPFVLVSGHVDAVAAALHVAVPQRHPGVEAEARHEEELALAA